MTFNNGERIEVVAVRDASFNPSYEPLIGRRGTVAWETMQMGCIGFKSEIVLRPDGSEELLYIRLLREVRKLGLLELIAEAAQ